MHSTISLRIAALAAFGAAALFLSVRRRLQRRPSRVADVALTCQTIRGFRHAVNRRKAVRDALLQRSLTLSEKEQAARKLRDEEARVPVLVDLFAMAPAATSIDGYMLTQLLVAAFAHLQAHKELLNKQNVFPVADGDTGTNMCLCLKKPARNLLLEPQRSVLDAVKNFGADVLLYGQGNSGTILSYFLISVAEELHELIEGESASVGAFGLALRKAGERMHSAVSNPVEGTLLSVIRDSCAGAALPAVRTVAELVQVWHQRAAAELAKTPEQLVVDGRAILKEAGVVDSGAHGFVLMLQGMLQATQRSGSALELSSAALFAAKANTASEEIESPPVAHDMCADTFQYCTEAVIRLAPGVVKEHVDATFRAAEARGLFDSLVVIVGPSRTSSHLLAKVHCHTDCPAEVFLLGESLGNGEPLIKEKVEDMRAQHAAAHGIWAPMDAMRRLGQSGREILRRSFKQSKERIAVVGYAGLPGSEGEAIRMLPTFIVSERTGEQYDIANPDVCPFTAAELFSRQRHAETRDYFSTAAPTPAQAFVCLELAMHGEKGNEENSVIAFTVASYASASYRNLLQAVEMMPAADRRRVHVYDLGGMCGAGTTAAIFQREALRCSRSGYDLPTTVERVNHIDRRSYCVTICGADYISNLMARRPEMMTAMGFPVGSEVLEGSRYVLGYLPPNSALDIKAKSKVLFKHVCSGRSLDEAMGEVALRTSAGLLPGQQLHDVMIGTVGRVDMANALSRVLQRELPVAGVITVHTQDLVYAAFDSYGMLSLAFWVQ